MSYSSFGRQDGFAIISVMVLIALIGVVGVAIARSISDMIEQERRAEAMIASHNVQRLVREIVQNGNSCDTAFRSAGNGQLFYPVGSNPNPPPIRIDEIWSPAPSSQPLFATGANLGHGAQLGRIQFIPNIPSNPQPVTIGGTPFDYYDGTLEIGFDHAAGATAFFGGNFSSRRLPLRLYVDAANKIAHCAMAGSYQEMCYAAKGALNTGTCQGSVFQKLRGLCTTASCPPTSPVPPGGCSSFAYLQGVDPLGNPVCNCSYSCP